MTTNTLETIRGELNARKGQWPAICERTGLDYSWLQKFAQGRIKNPGYGKIDSLSRDLFAVVDVAADQRDRDRRDADRRDTKQSAA